MQSSYTKQTVNNTYPRINIRDYMRTFLLDIREKEGRIFDMRHFGQAEHLKKIHNESKYIPDKQFKDFASDICYWRKQQVDFQPANLRGYIFYFICNNCARRVKYLFEYDSTHSPLCRKCCGLEYGRPKNKSRQIIRLLHKWHDQYYSSDVRYMIAKYAGITKEDLL